MKYLALIFLLGGCATLDYVDTKVDRLDVDTARAIKHHYEYQESINRHYHNAELDFMIFVSTSQAAWNDLDRRVEMLEKKKK